MYQRGVRSPFLYIECAICFSYWWRLVLSIGTCTISEDHSGSGSTALAMETDRRNRDVAVPGNGTTREGPQTSHRERRTEGRKGKKRR